MNLKRVAAGTVFYTIVSLVVSVPLAIAEEGLFEERYSGAPWMSGTGESGLVAWLLQKSLFALAVTLLLELVVAGRDRRLGAAAGVGVVVWMTTVATFIGLHQVLAVPADLWRFWAVCALLTTVIACCGAAWAMRRFPEEMR